MYVPMHTFGRAVQLLDELSGAAGPEGFAAVLLPGLAELIGCDVVTYHEVAVGHPGVRYPDRPPGAPDAGSHPVLVHVAHQHPVIVHVRAAHDPRAVSIRDLLGTAEFGRVGLHPALFRQLPVEHQLSITLTGNGPTAIGIAVHRFRAAFTDTDRALLTALGAPLLHGLQRARQRSGPAAPAPPVLARLSGREREVLELVVQGRTNVAIANALGTSPRTVAKHLEHIYRKLAVPGRAAAAALAAAG